MENWSELPRDLLSAIAKRLEAATDRVRFSGVCKNWSSLAKSEINYLPPNPPWLMMTQKTDSDDCDFIGADGKCFALKLPFTGWSICVGSSGCWLVMMDMACGLYIINPFSGSMIKLPSLLQFVEDYYEEDRILDFFRKVILSFHKSPEEEDFIAVAIHVSCKLAYTKAGTKSWQSIESTDNGFVDVLFFQDKIYVLKRCGIVSELNIHCSPDEKPNTVPVSDPLEVTSFLNQRYLVEFQGMLLQIINLDDYLESIDNKGFHVFQLNFSTGEWVKLNDLGQYSFFLGYNNGVSLLATSTSTFKPNCIYFTTDQYVKIQVGDELSYISDVGVFNLADSIFSLYSVDHYSEPIFTRPAWIIPTSLSKNQ